LHVALDFYSNSIIEIHIPPPESHITLS
jgi:hypothetical protein